MIAQRSIMGIERKETLGWSPEQRLKRPLFNPVAMEDIVVLGFSVWQYCQK